MYVSIIYKNYSSHFEDFQDVRSFLLKRPDLAQETLFLLHFNIK